MRTRMEWSRTSSCLYWETSGRSRCPSIPRRFCRIALIEGIWRPGFKVQEKDDLGAKIQTDCCTWLANRWDRIYDAVEVRSRPSHRRSLVALWSQYSSFSRSNEESPNLHRNPVAPGFTMSRKRHTYGAQYGSENCTGRGEQRAANLGTSTQTWRRRKRPSLDHVVF